MNLKERWPWVIITLSVFVSALYEYAYWSTFELNGLAYLSIEALIKNLAYVVFPKFTAGYLIQLMNLAPFLIKDIRNIGSNTPTVSSASSGDDEEVLTWVEMKHNFKTNIVKIKNISLFGFLITGLIFNKYSKIQDFPFWLVIVFILFFALHVAYNELFSFLGGKFIRGYFVFFLLNNSWSALFSGRAAALEIINGNNSSYVELSNEQSEKAHYSKLKFLGTLGDDYAFLSPDNSKKILITKREMPVLSVKIKSHKERGLPREN